MGAVIRLFGIPAAAADVVAVLRRGPSAWCHVGRWDVAANRYEPGSWLHGTLYPQRCDVSPDGRYLCYFALRKHSNWAAGDTYVAVCRLPWLTALAAWPTNGTYSWGAHFVADPGRCDPGPPRVGNLAGLRGRHGLALTSPVAFAVERRRGWVETPDSPPRPAEDMWDERRADQVRVGRPRPDPAGRGDARPWLVAGGGYAAHRASPDWYRPPAYELRAGPSGSVLARLHGVQWADWARDGRLLTALDDGRLQARDPISMAVTWEQDLSSLRPRTEAPPPEAGRW